ncbi:BA75_01910T0 [Komagataella pastoris]|uniref:U3 small nucleolar RNA-associated protein 10 n=1 Tax=Komagataella pastoris TaxID=4922 RepID=A0A1B2JAH3_PICPA|nr:BA75_01910T0 [Komagataella pastoris]
MSLSDQLSVIAKATQTLAIDRKSRVQLHSVSLIHDPKYAASQDYDSIFTTALEALDDLESLDSRFSKFRSSIFSDTSVTIDRLVQSKEQNKDLDRTVAAFLALLAPYWNLNIALQAAEWPLRRFSIHIHNTEVLLLSALPYYDQPVFKRILHVLPSFPHFFEWLASFKKLGTNPPRRSMIKFFADTDFYKLYAQYVLTQVSRQNEYDRQLVFFLSMSVSAIGALAPEQNRFVILSPIVLETAGSLLNSANNDARLTAYALLSVLSVATPLSRDVILASIDSILYNSNKYVASQALASVIKIYQTLQESPLNILPEHVFEKLEKNYSFTSESETSQLFLSNPSNNRFLTAYLCSLISYRKGKDFNAEFFKQFVFSKAQLKRISQELSNLFVSDSAIGNLVPITSLVKLILSLNEPLFVEVLSENGLNTSSLEMKLQCTLFSHQDSLSLETNNEDVTMDVVNSSYDEEAIQKQSVKSYLFINGKNSQFEITLQSFFLSIEANKFDHFLANAFVSTEAAVSFLIRVSITQSFPLKSRVFSLHQLEKILKKQPAKTALHTLLPFLLVVLSDQSEAVRSSAVDIIMFLNSRKSKSSKELFLVSEIYEPSKSKEVAMLSADDGHKVIAQLANLADSLKIDNEQLFRTTTKSILKEKKLGPIFLTYVATNAKVINIPQVSYVLLSIVIDGISSVKHASLSQLFEDTMKEYISERTKCEERCQITNFNVRNLDHQLLALVSPKEKSALAVNFLVSALSSKYQSLSIEAVLRIEQIFKSFKDDQKLFIVQHILEDAYLDTDEGEVTIYYDPLELLQSLELNGEIFTTILKDLTKTSTENVEVNGGVAKRRRRSSASTRQAMKDKEIFNVASEHLRKLTIVLECLEKASASKGFDTSLNLLKLLFNVLNELETLGADGKLPILYAQETLASTMLNIVKLLDAKKLDLSKVDSSSLRADMIVSTIRSSNSPQLQNKFLLVVAALASLSPEIVLHSVMPIFTFMGAQTLRQDDEFSSYVVENAISSVIPALAKLDNNKQSDEVEFLLSSFVSAFQHIPSHRRVKLFTKLANILGSKLSIHYILLLCGQQYASFFAKHKIPETVALVNFASSFLKNFSPKDQLDAFKGYIGLWTQIPPQPLDKDSPLAIELGSRPIFTTQLVSSTAGELFNLRSCLIAFIDKALTNDDSLTGSSVPSLRLKIASILCSQNRQEEVDAILSSFGALLEQVLSLLDSSSIQPETEISQGYYKLLTDLLGLLPIDQFVISIAEIFGRSDTSNVSLNIKRHLTTLAGSKIELENTDNEKVEETIKDLIPILFDNIVTSTNVELTQASLDTLSILFMKMNESLESSVFIRALEIITSEKKLLTQPAPELLISSINCVSSVINIMGVKMIGFFPKIIVPVFETFRSIETFNSDRQDLNSIDSDEDEEEQEELLDSESKELTETAILVLLSCMIRRIPAFLTPNIQDMLELIFMADSVPEATRVSVLDTINVHVDLSIVLKSLTSLWNNVSKLNPTSIGLFLYCMESTIEKIDKRSAINQATSFMKFLFATFEYRTRSKFEINTVNRIEASLFSSGIQYVMKLNDKTFRPIFASIGRWAFAGENAPHNLSEVDRLKAFFRFFNKMQDSLKGIITSYYSYILEDVIALLKRFSSGELVDLSLRRATLVSLISSFKYDQQEYWHSQARYDSVSKVLVDQLVNIEEDVGKQLVKALAFLAQDCSTDEHNKQLNDLLLKHLKSDCKSREKYWTIQAVQLIYKKVGENWLSLLPQLIPLIAELLEDDDEEVEMLVRSNLVGVIEGVLGEPLDLY